MKRFLVVAFLALTVTGLQAQADNQSKGWSQAEAEENYKALKGHVDALIDNGTDQDKRIDELKRQVIEMREHLARVSGVTYATPEDVKRLAEAILEVDRKRQADFNTLHNEIKNSFADLKRLVETSAAAAAAAAVPPPQPIRREPKPPKTEPTAEQKKESGYNYEVKKGDQLGMIVKAFRDQGVKVTRAQVIKANPSIDPDKLKVGQTLFIPDDSAKSDADKNK